MKPKNRRLALVVIGLAALGGAVALALNALRDNVVFFRSPTDVVESPQPGGRSLRLGGLVKKGSVHKLAGSPGARFVVTDLKNDVPVVYHGILPDLFREGQGVVVEGHLGADGVFAASEVLAKHDEKYMPPEVAQALKKAGRWKEYQDMGNTAGTK